MCSKILHDSIGPTCERFTSQCAFFDSVGWADPSTLRLSNSSTFIKDDHPLIKDLTDVLCRVRSLEKHFK